MKKFFAFFVPVLFSLTAKCQVEFGAFAGPQITYSHYLVRDAKQENEIKYGFQAGAIVKVPFEANLYFSPVGFYSMKGYKVTLSRPAFPPDTTATDNNTTLHTFEISPLLEYDFGKNPGHFFVRAGPSLDLQLFGKENFHRTTGAPVSRNMKFSFGDYGHFAMNLLLHFGFETGSGLMIFLHYTHGIGSINNADYGPRIFHRAAGLSIGYFFNRKKIVMDTRNKE